MLLRQVNFAAAVETPRNLVTHLVLHHMFPVPRVRTAKSNDTASSIGTMRVYCAADKQQDDLHGCWRRSPGDDLMKLDKWVRVSADRQS